MVALTARVASKACPAKVLIVHQRTKIGNGRAVAWGSFERVISRPGDGMMVKPQALFGVFCDQV
jgi:hypothetical protein